MREESEEKRQTLAAQPTNFHFAKNFTARPSPRAFEASSDAEERGGAVVGAAAFDNEVFGSATPAREGFSAERRVLLTRADRDHLGVHRHESPALALRKKRLGPSTAHDPILA